MAFLSQQATEKALKALYIHTVKESPGPTHSLLFLGKSVKIPDEFFSGLRKLSPDFVITLYPDAAHGVPYELYGDEIAKEKLEIAKKCYKMGKKRIEELNNSQILPVDFFFEKYGKGYGN